MLQEGNNSDAAVDGVAKTHVGLISEGIDCVFALRRLQLVEKLGHVTRPENFVNVCEFLRLVRWKIRREYTLRLTLSPQKFTSRAW